MTDLVDSPDIFGFSIFCDDIRYEMDGKTNFIGAYRGILFLEQLPAILPKFGIGLSFWQRKNLFNPDLQLEIFMPGDPDDKASIVGAMSQVIDGRPASPLPPVQPDTEFIVLYANLIFAPFSINEAGLMKVRLRREDKRYRLGSLRIAHAQQAEPNPSSNVS